MWNEYTIGSKQYKIFLWAAAILVLALDIYTYGVIVFTDFNITLVALIISAIGILWKSSVVFVLVYKHGPLKLMIYIWGGVFILAAMSGLVATVTSLENESIQRYLKHLAFLVVGLLLVVPAKREIRYINE